MKSSDVTIEEARAIIARALHLNEFTGSGTSGGFRGGTLGPPLSPERVRAISNSERLRKLLKRRGEVQVQTPFGEVQTVRDWLLA